MLTNAIDAYRNFLNGGVRVTDHDVGREDVECVEFSGFPLVRRLTELRGTLRKSLGNASKAGMCKITASIITTAMLLRDTSVYSLHLKLSDDPEQRGIETERVRIVVVEALNRALQLDPELQAENGSTKSKPKPRKNRPRKRSSRTEPTSTMNAALKLKTQGNSCRKIADLLLQEKYTTKRVSHETVRQWVMTADDYWKRNKSVRTQQLPHDGHGQAMISENEE